MNVLLLLKKFHNFRIFAVDKKTQDLGNFRYKRY